MPGYFDDGGHDWEAEDRANEAAEERRREAYMRRHCSECGMTNASHNPGCPNADDDEGDDEE